MSQLIFLTFICNEKAITWLPGVLMRKKNSKNSVRAAHFKETRNNRLSEISEDYTELINDLSETQGQVRICDISRELGVSHVSVLKTVRRLIQDGYLYKNFRYIGLTPKGKEMAVSSKRKHLILSDFLRKLGVPESIAATDVEGIEHYISSTTLEAIYSHMEKYL